MAPPTEGASHSFTMKFTMDNAAFWSGKDGEDFNPYPEILRILDELRTRIAKIGRIGPYPIFDANGNGIGQAIIE